MEIFDICVNLMLNDESNMKMGQQSHGNENLFI